MNIHFSLCAKLNSTRQHSFSLDHHYPLDFFHGIFHQSSQGTSIVLALLLASSALFSLPEKRRRLMDRFWLGPRHNVGWLHFKWVSWSFSDIKESSRYIKRKWYVQLNFWKSTEKNIPIYVFILDHIERTWAKMDNNGASSDGQDSLQGASLTLSLSLL